MGEDGNLFYCNVCRDVGDVVCCDGCPNVYHPSCVCPGPSRSSLEADDDPWYCPECFEKHHSDTDGGETFNRTEFIDRRARADTFSTMSFASDLDDDFIEKDDEQDACVAGSEGDGKEEHFDDTSSGGVVDRRFVLPGGRGGRWRGKGGRGGRGRGRGGRGCDPSSPRKPRLPRAAAADTGVQSSPRKKRSGRPRLTEEEKDERKRIRKLRDMLHEEADDEEREHRSKKSRIDGGGEDDVDDGGEKGKNFDEEEDFLSTLSTSNRNSDRPAGATPAFFLFLSVNRFRIEKHILKHHRSFKTMRRGYDKNMLIAKEGAAMWLKLSNAEQKKYTSMSMHDFENRVIAWKEEEQIRAMTGVVSAEDPAGNADDADDADDAEDQKYWQERHRNVVSLSQIRCSPSDLDDRQKAGRNQILLDLLQDIRFHPLPLVDCSRSEEVSTKMNNPIDPSKVALAQYHVQGPLATSVGDECVGCTRGWNHFCPVLQRQFPAVEYRAKLQPPLTALMATRIGLGLKAPTESRELRDNGPKSSPSRADRFSAVSSFYLTEPSTRTDDPTVFIEQASSLRLHESMADADANDDVYARPAVKMLSRGLLPTARGRKKREKKDDSNGDTFYKCNVCGSHTRSRLGCVSCRGEKLVAEMTKLNNCGTSMQPTRVYNAVLGRAPLGNSNFHKQSDGEKAISFALAGFDWKPNVLMPFDNILISSEDNAGSGSDGEDKASRDDSDKNMDIDMEVKSDKVITSEESANDLESIAVGATVIHDTSDSTSADDDDDNNNNNDYSTASSSLKPERSARHGLRKRRETGHAISMFDASGIREKDLVAHKQEAEDLHRRCVSIATSGILLAMMRRDPLRLFADPVPDSVEEYKKVVKKPIDFGIIRKRVLRGKYSSLAAFVADASLLCANALIFNPAGTIYAITAKNLYETLIDAESRASEWISTIKRANAAHSSRKLHQKEQVEVRPTRTLRSRTPMEGGDDSNKSDSNKSDNNESNDSDPTEGSDPFEHLRTVWPGAAEVLETEKYLKAQLLSDFMRTRENEAAYYGRLAIRRMATAAQVSRAKNLEKGGVYHPVLRRNHREDEALRCQVDESVSNVNHSVQLKGKPSWREKHIFNILKMVQSRRIDNMTTSKSGCARCDGKISEEAKPSMPAGSLKRKRKRNLDKPRVDRLRLEQTTGLASARAREQNSHNIIDIGDEEQELQNIAASAARDESVSIRGSNVHGWGLYAEHAFKAGEVVAEYLGEYISHAVADKREIMYRDRRIQDYQFRVSEDLIIDATLKGGYARYINHSCDPNCIAKIIDGAHPNECLKRVIIVAQKSIHERDEITYDYQFPLEPDLECRIVCNCGAKKCRGFMNWDLIETNITRKYAVLSTSKGRSAKKAKR